MKELYKALATFQDNCPSFVKNVEGYGYKYTDLPTITKTINPLLRKQGLLLYQESVSSIDMIGVISHLVHIESGKELTSKLEMPLVELKSMNLYQAAGSAITYIRRYDMSNLLGLLSEKDDDGGSGKTTGKRIAKKRGTPASPGGAPKGGALGSKPLLTPDSEKWQQGVDFIKKGGDVNAITSNYNISDEHLKLMKG